MATTTLHSFAGCSIDSINRVNKLFRFTPQLSQCAWSSPESTPGACDGGHPCQRLATVHDLDDDLPYCSKHFRQGGAQ
jgi:hypothetical protein